MISNAKVSGVPQSQVCTMAEFSKQSGGAGQTAMANCLMQAAQIQPSLKAEIVNMPAESQRTVQDLLRAHMNAGRADTAAGSIPRVPLAHKKIELKLKFWLLFRQTESRLSNSVPVWKLVPFLLQSASVAFLAHLNIQNSQQQSTAIVFQIFLPGDDRFSCQDLGRSCEIEEPLLGVLSFFEGPLHGKVWRPWFIHGTSWYSFASSCMLRNFRRCWRQSNILWFMHISEYLYAVRDVSVMFERFTLGIHCQESDEDPDCGPRLEPVAEDGTEEVPAKKFGGDSRPKCVLY